VKWLRSTHCSAQRRTPKQKHELRRDAGGLPAASDSFDVTSAKTTPSTAAVTRSAVDAPGAVIPCGRRERGHMSGVFAVLTNPGHLSLPQAVPTDFDQPTVANLQHCCTAETPACKRAPARPNSLDQPQTLSFRGHRSRVCPRSAFKVPKSAKATWVRSEGARNPYSRLVVMRL
jgi:hypothetical protein